MGKATEKTKVEKTKVKVRHGLAHFTDENDHHRTVFRSQVVSMPVAEAERLRALGAVVDANEELPMSGRLTPIPNTASDEEMIAWASVATRAEIVTAISENPALGDRILAARDTVQRRMEAQNQLLGGLEDTVEEGKAQAKKKAKVVKRGAPTSGANGKNANAIISEANDADDEIDDLDPDDEEDDDEIDDLDEDDPRSVVRGDVAEISAWLVAHPNQAEEILEAEKDWAMHNQAEVRPAVVTAVAETVSARNQ